MTNKFNPENEPNEWLREELAGDVTALGEKVEPWIRAFSAALRNNIEQVNTLTSMLVFGVSAGHIRI